MKFYVSTYILVLCAFDFVDFNVEIIEIFEVLTVKLWIICVTQYHDACAQTHSEKLLRLGSIRVCYSDMSVQDTLHSFDLMIAMYMLFLCNAAHLVEDIVSMMHS